MALEFTTQSTKLPLKLRVLKAAVTGVGRIAPARIARYGFKMFITPKRRHITAAQREFLRTGQQFHIQYGALPLVAYRWGEGKPVLLVHGWQAHAATMQHFVDPLVNAGYQVVAIDAPAHGDSPGTTLDLIQYSEAVLCAINCLGGVHALIAHSIGTIAVATMLATHLHYRVEKTVFIGAVDSLTSMLDRYATGFGLNRRVQNAMYHIIEQRYGSPDRFSSPDLLEDYPYPMLIVHDQDDTISPFACGEAIARRVHSARLLATQGLGHRKILAHSDTIDQIVAFVNEEEII